MSGKTELYLFFLSSAFEGWGCCRTCSVLEQDCRLQMCLCDHFDKAGSRIVIFRVWLDADLASS